jgi:hypothetical protein
MQPVKAFQTIEEELEYLRLRVKTAYRDSRTKPENCADAKNILIGIRENLEPYYNLLEAQERAELTFQNINEAFKQ